MFPATPAANAQLPAGRRPVGGPVSRRRGRPGAVRWPGRPAAGRAGPGLGDDVRGRGWAAPDRGTPHTFRRSRKNRQMLGRSRLAESLQRTLSYQKGGHVVMVPGTTAISDFSRLSYPAAAGRFAEGGGWVRAYWAACSPDYLASIPPRRQGGEEARYTPGHRRLAGAKPASPSG